MMVGKRGDHFRSARALPVNLLLGVPPVKDKPKTEGFTEEEKAKTSANLSAALQYSLNYSVCCLAYVRGRPDDTLARW